MAYQDKQPPRQKSGWGSIRRNESDNPNAPLFKGAMTVHEGGEHWVAVFKSRKKPGTYDLSFEAKEPPARQKTYSQQLMEEEDNPMPEGWE